MDFYNPFRTKHTKTIRLRRICLRRCIIRFVYVYNFITKSTYDLPTYYVYATYVYHVCTWVKLPVIIIIVYLSEQMTYRQPLCRSLKKTVWSVGVRTPEGPVTRLREKWRSSRVSISQNFFDSDDDLLCLSKAYYNNTRPYRCVFFSTIIWELNRTG